MVLREISVVSDLVFLCIEEESLKLNGIHFMQHSYSSSSDAERTFKRVEVAQ